MWLCKYCFEGGEILGHSKGTQKFCPPQYLLQKTQQPATKNLLIKNIALANLNQFSVFDFQ